MAVRKPTTVRQIELTRALRAFKNAGLQVAHAEIDMVAGKVIIMTGAGAQQSAGAVFEEWERKRARSA